VDATRVARFFDFVITFGSKFWKIFKIKDPSVLSAFIKKKNQSKINNCFQVFEIFQRTDVCPERTDKGQMGSGRFFDRFFGKKKKLFFLEENHSLGAIRV
jgi:hypothetical protein